MKLLVTFCIKILPIRLELKESVCEANSTEGCSQPWFVSWIGDLVNAKWSRFCSLLLLILQTLFQIKFQNSTQDASIFECEKRKRKKLLTIRSTQGRI